MIHTYAPHQLEAHEERHRGRLSRLSQTIRWGRREGKTYYALCEMLEEACAFAGAYAYLAPTWSMMSVAMHEFAGLVAPWRWSHADWPNELRGPLVGGREVRLPNGSIITFSERLPLRTVGVVVDEGFPGALRDPIEDLRFDWQLWCFSRPGARR